MKLRSLAAVVVLPLLAGCSLIPGYEVAKTAVVGATITGIEDRKQVNDLQAQATFAAVCDLSVGAVGRTSDPIDRQYAVDKCLNGGGATVNINDLQRTLMLLEQLRGIGTSVP